MVEALKLTPDIASPVVVGEEGELDPPQRVAEMAASNIKGKARDEE
jgi:hypothetical protein